MGRKHSVSAGVRRSAGMAVACRACFSPPSERGRRGDISEAIEILCPGGAARAMEEVNHPFAGDRQIGLYTSR